MLRLGIILTVTAVIGLVHYLSRARAVFPRPVELTIEIALLVAGIVLLVLGLKG